MEKKKKKFHWWYIPIAILLVSSISAAIGGDSKKPPKSPSNNASQVSASIPATQHTEKIAAAPAPTPEEQKTVSVNMEIGSGHYTSGIDFPAGKYDLTATAGGGNVNSSNAYNGGINAIMGVSEKNKNGMDMYEQEYANIALPDGETISLTGVTLRITCANADGDPLKPRNQTITDNVTLGNGNFVAGEDFPAGIYNLSVTSGGGNVSSDNAFAGGINAIIGVADKNKNGIDMYEQSYRNVELPGGTTLSVSGVGIMLSPSK